MHRNILKKNWFTLMKELKERWPDMTQSDIDYISGHEDRLIEIVEKRRHISRTEAERDVSEFLDNLDPKQRPPQ
jgi:hypothetical protein